MNTPTPVPTIVSALASRDGAEVLSVAEVIHATGFGRTTIYNAMSTGALRARKLGRRTIIMREDLRAFLAALPAFQSEASGARAA